MARGRDLDIAALIQQIQSPPVTKVGVLELEAFYPAKDRFGLAMALNNLLAAPGFSAWMEGEPLDIQHLLYTPAGKPRLAIFSIAHLNDAERMFFVSLLLNQALGWMRTQSGTTSLRALIYMDEIFGYLPPVANPPSKLAMLTLLKQARAFGVGMVLATQNPVDIDYKALSNAGTWFVGRLQTERDQMRVLDGLEGASANGGVPFDRQAMGRAAERPRQPRVPDAQRARGCAGGLREPLGDVVPARPADALADQDPDGPAPRRVRRCRLTPAPAEPARRALQCRPRLPMRRPRAAVRARAAQAGATRGRTPRCCRPTSRSSSRPPPARPLHADAAWLRGRPLHRCEVRGRRNRATSWS